MPDTRTTWREYVLGRFALTLPADAELASLSVLIDEVELDELDLGDSSPEAFYLGWVQVSEAHREVSGYDEERVDSGCWIARYGVAEPTRLMLEQRGESALLLRAPSSADLDPLARMHDLRKRYMWPQVEPRPQPSFGLGRGLLELAPELPEELSATFVRPGGGWTLTLATGAVAVPSPSDYEGMVASIRGANLGKPVEVEFRRRTVDGLAGEELLMTIGSGRVSRLEHEVMWRYPGEARNPARPEVELEFSRAGVTREVALAEWEELVASLRLADRGAVEA